jgi:UDP-GlcNAc:undecaprenyl-phosphate/decaprenyl-phosphate GlcNAc-1-phosphate transferase
MSAQLILAPLLAFVIAYVLISRLVSSAVLKVLDYPNTRSLHSAPIPRTGGVGIVIGILASWSLPNMISLPLELWVGVGLLAVVSFVDDLRSLPIFLRLLVHSVVAMVFSTSLFYASYGGMLTFGVALGMLWMINLYNFMDGSDGLAGGMTLIGFGCYGLSALLMGHHVFATINFCIMGAAAAFLLFNFHPARIFMGDVGSVPLGYLAAALGILGWIQAVWSMWFPLLVFFPFIADATATLAKRLWKGERIWQAHCKHYYQRLVQSGFGHRKTALLGYMIMLIAGGSALWSIQQDFMTQGLLVGIWVGIYFIMMAFFDHYQRNHSSDEQNDCN